MIVTRFFNLIHKQAMICLIVFALLAGSIYAQERQPLPPLVTERIAQLKELVDYHLAREKIDVAVSYMNQISYTYWENQRPDLAAESFLSTVPYYEQLKDYQNLHNIYSNVGLIYLDLENVVKADQAFAKNLEVNRSIGDRKGIVTALVDQAYVKNLLRDYRESISLLEEALTMALEINYESVLPNIYRQLSTNYTNIGNTREGQAYMQKYNDARQYISRQTMQGEFQVQQEQSQVEILRQQAEARLREKEMEINRTRFKYEQDSISAVVQAQEDSLELERQNVLVQRQSIELLEQQTQLDQAEIERQLAVQSFQQLVIYSAFGGVALLVILAVIMFRNNKAKQRANRELAQKNIQIEQASEKLQEAFVKIEDQNFRITQSISYARDIQRSLFPPIETLNHYLPDSFIFFRPVDLVSGDFYWFREVNNVSDPEHTLDFEDISDPVHMSNPNLRFRGDKFIVTAVDCTGHGVPGAFMSMIGYNLLDSITSTGTTHPGKILGRLHKGVRRALKQEESANRDGMDISLCVINRQTNMIEFSGANNPVIVIRNGEVEVIRGNRMAIGGSQKKAERIYESHEIPLVPGTCFYSLTDGYPDQFGGEDGRKYTMKNLTEFLLDIHTKPMSEQRLLIEENFVKWKGSDDQIDDVLIIGFRV